VIENTLV